MNGVSKFRHQFGSVRSDDGAPIRASVRFIGGPMWPWRAEYPFVPDGGSGDVVYRSELFWTWAGAMGWVNEALAFPQSAAAFAIARVG